MSNYAETTPIRHSILLSQKEDVHLNIENRTNNIIVEIDSSKLCGVKRDTVGYSEIKLWENTVLFPAQTITSTVKLYPQTFRGINFEIQEIKENTTYILMYGRVLYHNIVMVEGEIYIPIFDMVKGYKANYINVPPGLCEHPSTAPRSCPAPH